MKTYIKIFLVLIAIFSSGCLDVDILVKVNPDGSGTIVKTILMSKEMAGMMSSMTESFESDSAEPHEFSLYDVESLKSEAEGMGDDVAYLSSEEIDLPDKEGFKAVYSFADLNKVKINQNPVDETDMNAMASSMESNEADKKYVNFEFTEGNPAVMKINLSLDDEIEEEKEIAEETAPDTTTDNSGLEQLKYFLKGFRIAMGVEINGEITETNASYVNDSRITLFSVDFDKILENPESWKKFGSKINRPESMEDLKELVENIAGIRVELNNPVVVEFK